MKRFLQKIFGDRVSRLNKRLDPVVASVKEWADSYGELPDEDFPRKTDEFIQRVAQGETLDDIMPEAYGLVYETCRRLLGRTWKVVGHDTTWDMVPFDVQIVGAIVLHEGSIAEMATGEGKTLVATMPLYLNALAKKGVHLVTVNDYLAKRTLNGWERSTASWGSRSAVSRTMTRPSENARSTSAISYMGRTTNSVLTIFATT